MSAHLYARDCRLIRRKAEEILRQCDHFERNGPGDEIRFGFLRREALEALFVATRSFRRLHRERGWPWPS